MLALVVSVPPSEVDLASDVLWQLGVRAIEERAVPGPGSDERVELWTSVGDEGSAIASAERVLGNRWPVRSVAMADADVAAGESWRDYARPMHVDERLVVVPAWCEPPVTPSSSVVVRVEPGGAFGLGDHPTTLLSLRATSRLIDGPCDVIDVGCGTGVIAVAAALLQQRPVRAVDIAAAAVEATVDNARRNEVSDRVVVDTAPVHRVEGDFDLVVANILAPTLVELGTELRRLTRVDGRLVISGILADRHRHVLDALAPMQVEEIDVLDGWAAITLRHAPRN